MAVVTTAIANSAVGLQPARTISGQLLYSSNHWASRCLAGYYYIFQLLTKKISWAPPGHPITVVKLLKTEAIMRNYSKKISKTKPNQNAQINLNQKTRPPKPTQQGKDYYDAPHIGQCYTVLQDI